jgi:hypothetical protein
LKKLGGRPAIWGYLTIMTNHGGASTAAWITESNASQQMWGAVIAILLGIALTVGFCYLKGPEASESWAIKKVAASATTWWSN